MPRSSLSGALVLTASTLLAACNKPEPPPPPPPVPVTTLEVAPRRVPILVEAVGRTEGSKEVEVRARVSGILDKVLYAEGTSVRAGAPLFQIDRAPFEIALAQARAALAQERSRNEQTSREADRLKELVAKRAISQREADDAGSNFKTSSASMQAADAKIREAELNLSYTHVAAPIAGVTGRALRSQGSLVNAGTDSSLLTTVSQTDPIWVRFALAETEQQVLREASGKAGGKGNEVKLVLPDGKVHPVSGRLNFAGSTVDTRLGTVQLRAEFPNPDLSILPGQFVRAQVVAGMQDAIVVPQTAVLQGDQGRFVWTVGPEGKALPRVVETGAWIGPNWIIQKGLKAGDKVIVDNLLKLRPGTAVQLQAAGAPAPKPGAADKAAPPKSDTPADAKKGG
jgi:membrane fusion protein (multidrug efflux system)